MSNLLLPFILCFLVLLSVLLLWLTPTKKKSHEVRSGLRGGHFVSPRHPNHRPRKWLASQARTGSLQSAGAPSFMAMQLFVLSHLETVDNTKLSSIPCRWLRHLTWCTFFSITLYIFLRCFTTLRGPGSSVGIVTGYGLDGSGIESRLGRDIPHLSRPALGPTRPPVQLVPRLSRG